MGTPAWIILCAGAGLLIGSFLSVVADRVPDRRSVVTPPSTCPRCGHRLGARDLVPVASWLATRGRCRHCGAPIGYEPLIIEISTAFVWAALGWRFGANVEVIPFLVMGSALVPLTWIDLREMRLPREISYPATALSFSAMLVIAASDSDWARVADGIIGAVVATAAMALIYVVSRGGMGDGDVRIAPLLGLHLGYINLWLVPYGLFLGFAFGALVGIGAIVFGRATRRTAVPLGPFLALGTLTAVLWSDSVLRLAGVTP